MRGMKRFVVMAATLVAGFCVLETIAQQTSPPTIKMPPAQKLGFGAVIGNVATGSIAISSGDGAAMVYGKRSAQIGTGPDILTADDTLRYRDKVIIDADGGFGIVAFGQMRSKYTTYLEDWLEGGYVVNVTATNPLTGVNGGGSKFAERANEGAWRVLLDHTANDNDEIIQIVNDGPSGWLKIETEDAANDTMTLYLTGESAALAAGKPMWFGTSWEVEDVDKDDVFVGVSTVPTINWWTNRPSDYVGFKNDADGNLDFVVAQNGTATSIDTLVNLVDACSTNGYRKVNMAFAWDGVANILVTVNGTVITNLADNGTTVVFPDDEAMTPTICLRTTDTGKDYLRMDFIGVIQER